MSKHANTPHRPQRMKRHNPIQDAHGRNITTWPWDKKRKDGKQAMKLGLRIKADWLNWIRWCWKSPEHEA